MLVFLILAASIFLFIVIGAARIIYCLFYLFSNFKMFKYFFKKPFSFYNMLLIFLTASAMTVLASEIIFIRYNNYKPCTRGIYEFRHGYKRGVSYINQCLTLHKALNNDKVEYDNAENFAKILMQRADVIEDLTRYTADDKGKFKKYSKRELNDKKLNIAQYENKPSFTTVDGIMFVITKFENGCKNVDMEHTENNDCLMDIDTTNLNPPNRMTQNSRPQDRITLIINGNKDVIIPSGQHAPVFYNERAE